MRDNLIFYNIAEEEKEDTTAIIHQLLEEKLEMQDARTKVRIDRSHRLGKRRSPHEKPRPIVANFNYFQDKETVIRNAKKLTGTRIGIAEQYPQEIVKIRQKLYPELKKAKDAGKRAKIIRDKLIIDGHEFKPTDT